MYTETHNVQIASQVSLDIDCKKAELEAGQKEEGKKKII